MTEDFDDKDNTRIILRLTFLNKLNKKEVSHSLKITHFLASYVY